MEDEVLRDLGFSEREVKVYLALLRLGETTVGPIAAKTRIQHSKIYHTLEKLVDRGLVSFVVKSGAKYFQAQDPKHILDSLKEKERRFSEILPVLHKRHQFSKEPQIATIYEGYRAIKSMFSSIIDGLYSKSYYYVFAFREEYISSPSASKFLRNIHTELAKKDVDDRLIANSAVKKEIRKNYADVKNTKLRFTDRNFPLGLMIIDDRVINWVWGERPTAVEIISKQFAQQYKKFFLEMWKIAKP